MKLGAVVGVVIVLVAAVVVLTRGDSRAVANAAPDIRLEYFDGTSQNLSDLRGRPVVLNFWASWCPTCIAEMPHFGEVHRQFADQVQFIGLNMQEVDLDAAAELMDVTGVEYRMAHDRQGAIYREFGGIARPTTVLITAEGSVARVHAGFLAEDDLVTVIETDLLG